MKETLILLGTTTNTVPSQATSRLWTNTWKPTLLVHDNEVVRHTQPTTYSRLELHTTPTVWQQSGEPVSIRIYFGLFVAEVIAVIIDFRWIIIKCLSQG